MRVSHVGLTIAGFAVASFKPRTPYAIPTPDNVLSSAIATKCNVVMCVPAFVEVRFVFNNASPS